MLFAHSLNGRPTSYWEPLSHHLARVDAHATRFADDFGWAALAGVAGRLHDIGKCSAEYQAYIAQPAEEGVKTRGPDHSTAGARVASETYGGPFGRILAFAIAGHHAGLANADNLIGRLRDSYPIKPFGGWQAETGPLPELASLKPTQQMALATDAGFTHAFLIRMLFSCLVDADFLETERFYAGADNEPVPRGNHMALGILRDRLHTFMADKQARADDTPVNILRARVREHALAKATLPPGLFTMSVPTGGGKTLASLSFALDHAIKHGLRRVIYVIPFTSIIEQTATVFREALAAKGDILEHHASFDWEKARGVADADSEGPNGVEKLRRAAENWDVPIVVTTAVQFFESLYANRTSHCRKLHNIARSVVILDEAQTIPVHLLRPCTAAINELANNYRTTVVLCTATQPALRAKDGFTHGLAIDDDRELAPDPQRLYAELKRVTVETRQGETPDTDIAARFREQSQMLCIVNSRAHARALFNTIRALPGAIHLTTLMCPVHRREKLGEIRAKLKTREPVRLVATSLVEAGVDVDFPEVWRAAAGLDSIAQAAGRCNREGGPRLGRVVVFTPAEAKPPHELKAFWQAARPVLRSHEGTNQNILGLDAIRTYFKTLYWQKGDDALDAKEVDGLRGILAAIGARAKTFDFPFEGISNAFRMIDTVMEPVIVPFDGKAEQTLKRIAAMDRPLTRDLRILQQYTVSIPRDVRDRWWAASVLTPVHPALASGLLRLADCAHYSEETGLDIADPAHRSAESNLM